jgi:hypothetical protein
MKWIEYPTGVTESKIALRPFIELMENTERLKQRFKRNPGKGKMKVY